MKRRLDRKFRCFSQNHIDVDIEENMRAKWRFIRFYSAPDSRSRSATWELLKDLSRNNSLSWVVGGDFNEILYSFEKKERVAREVE